MLVSLKVRGVAECGDTRSCYGAYQFLRNRVVMYAFWLVKRYAFGRHPEGEANPKI